MKPREKATLRGDITYIGSPCKKGHTKRYTVSANCVKCMRERDQCGKPQRNKKPLSKPYSAADEARLHEGNALRYYGKPCDKPGHVGLRYTRTNRCVDCSDELNAANRPPRGLTKAERLKWKRQRRIDRRAAEREMVEGWIRSAQEQLWIQKGRPIDLSAEDALLWFAIAV